MDEAARAMAASHRPLSETHAVPAAPGRKDQPRAVGSYWVRTHADWLDRGLCVGSDIPSLAALASASTAFCRNT